MCHKLMKMGQKKEEIYFTVEQQQQQPISSSRNVFPSKLLHYELQYELLVVVVVC